MMADKIQPAPDPLPLDQLALLRAYRQEHAMPGAAKAQLIERLESGKAQRAISPQWIAAGVAVAAAVVLAVGVSALGSRAARGGGAESDGNQAMRQPDATETTQLAAGHAPEPASRPSKQGPRLEQVDPAPSPAPLVELPDPPPALTPTEAEGAAGDRTRPEPVPVRKAKRPSPGPTTGVEPRGPSQLALERALLARAWSALAADDNSRALSLATQHSNRFALGTLSVERDAIATMASCKARRAGWAKLAANFLLDHGKTPLARRVREACEPGENKTTKN